MSFKNQLVAGFIGFALLFLLTVFPICSYYLSRKESILNAVNSLNSYYLNLVHAWQIQSEFINYETRNTHYFETHQSQYLENLKIREDRLDLEFRKLLQICQANRFGADELLLSIQSKWYTQSKLFAQLVSSVERRGFKDYGIEGQMRNNVHLLEKHKELDQLKVLNLRRHEKDYMIRNDSVYVNQLNQLVSVMERDIKNDQGLNHVRKDTLLTLLTNYGSFFNQLVAVDLEIGIRSKTGLMAGIVMKNKEIEDELVQTQKLVISKKNSLFKSLETIYILSSLILILMSIIISLYISKLITRPFSILTASIKELVLNNFEKPLSVKIKNSPKEINDLTNEFNHMVQHLNQKENARQMAHNDFLESEKKYKDVLNLLPQSIFEIDLNGTYTYVNSTWKDQLFYTDDDVHEGIRLSDTISINTEADIIANEIEDKDIKVIRKDGSHFHGMIFTSPILKDGEMIGERGVIIDISERIKSINELKKEKAKAEESDKLKSAFLANMSHEIRTPMNAIIGFSEMLKDPDLTMDEREEFISIINANSESLLKLIEDIVDIAKIESGYINLQKSDFNLHKMSLELQKSIKEIKKQNRKQNIKLINLNENDLVEDIIITDQNRLRQVLVNLLTNAVIFTNSGFIRFGFRISEDKTKVIFLVQDTGIGIPKEKQEIIFEPFRKASEDDKQLYPGTGLGLYITKTLVKLLEGEIWMDSIPGVGSNFHFSIPYQRSIANLTLKVAEPVQSLVNIAGVKILIAEDIESNYLLIKSMLKSHNVQLVWVKNGIEAVDFFLNNNTADLILMDIGMPLMNGYEATRQIKLIRSEIPIIMQTAHAMTGQKEKCLDFGANDYIAKPIKQSDLVEKINQLIHRITKQT